jgi:hypothetical protein
MFHDRKSNARRNRIEGFRDCHSDSDPDPERAVSCVARIAAPSARKACTSRTYRGGDTHALMASISACLSGPVASRRLSVSSMPTEPQAAADRSRIVDRLLDRFEIVGLVGVVRQVRRRGGRYRRLRPGAVFVRRGLTGLGRRTPLRRRSCFQPHGLLPQNPISQRRRGGSFLHQSRAPSNGWAHGSAFEFLDNSFPKTEIQSIIVFE